MEINRMKRSKRKRVKASDIIINGVLIFTAAITLYPLIFVVIASISDPTMVNSGKVILIPKGLHLTGYQSIIRSTWVLVGYRNSAIYTIIGTFLNVFVTFMGGYALSRKDLYGKKIITLYIVFTMWFGGGLIPTFIVVNNLGLYNRPYTLIILGLVSVYNLIICKSFIQNSIPGELQEAARIDGCSDFKILWRVIFPLSGPVLAILCLYYALAHWNSYFNALIYLKDRKLQTLQVFLREILVQNQTVVMDASNLEDMVERAQMAQVMKYSLIVIASVPMLVVYPFLQRFFVKGIMIGSVKG